MAKNYKSIAKKLKFEGKFFINGKYVNAIDGNKFKTINPETGEKLCTVAKCLPCGTVSVNTFSEGDIKTPFGGYKQSGSLSRDQGTEALNSFLQTKTIWISHS